MNAKMEKHPDSIAEQAATHFARRHDANLSQRRERDAWLNQDPRHAQAYDELQQLWGRMGGLRDDPELQALKAADLSALRRPSRFRPQRLLAVAATLALMIGVGYLAVRFAQPAPVVYATALGERRTETLPDGSRIVLNTDSTLEVHYSRGRRDVSLKQGEAQFDVAHDSTRPFVVHAGSDTVTALGTRFQVRRDWAVRVTLLEGSVEVAHGDATRRLKPDEQALLSDNSKITVEAIDPALLTGWLDGWMRFRDASLADVIAEANRYSPRKLRLGDPKLASVALNGNFRTGDSTSIAHAIELILPVKADIRSDEIVLRPQRH